MWDELFGTGDTRPIDWSNAQQVQQAIAAANSGFNAAYQAGASATGQQSWQQLNSQATQQLRQRANTWSPTDWVWNGTPCTIEEFAERCYGDTPERTHFLLKYKGIDE